MMFKVFLRTIGFPFLLALLIFRPPADRLSVRLFILIGILVWLLIRLFSNKRNYLSALALVDDTVTIRFITAQLSAKDLQLNVHDISGMKLSEANFPYSYAGSLRIHANEQWYSFLIIDRKLFDKIDQEITSAYSAFAK